MKNVIEYVTINIPLPKVSDVRLLEVVGAGLVDTLTQYKELGLDFTEFSVADRAKYTMGDHASEICSGDDDFIHLYEGASDQLSLLLAAYWVELETFAERIDGIKDIMVLEYPNVLRLCVREK